MPAPFPPLPAATSLVAILLLSACVGAPPHPRALEEVRRGYAHLADGENERAEVAFEHALEMAPALPEAQAGLGVVHRIAGRPDRALPHLDAAVAADGDLAEAHAARGEALLALGQSRAGLSALADALAIDPDQVAARLVRARWLSRSASGETAGGRDALLAQARRDLLHGLEASPDLALLHHDLAWVEWLRGDFRAAAAAYGRSARLDPSHAASHLGECAALAAAGERARAERACARCRDTAPPRSEVARRCASLPPGRPE